MDDPLPADSFIIILLLLVILLVSALLSSADSSVSAADTEELERRAQSGDKKAKRVLKITDKSEKLSFTVGGALIFFGFLFSALSVLEYYAPLCKKMPNILAFLLIAVVSAFIFTVFAVFVPRRVAEVKATVSALRVSAFAAFFLAVWSPISAVQKFITDIFARLLGVSPDAEGEKETEDAILDLIDEGEEKGEIDENQREMINNIFELDDRKASDVMTHRTDLTAVCIDDTPSHAIEIAVRDGYSRIPVYGEDIDDIKGVISVKDFLQFAGQKIPSDLKISDVMREAEFVPETKPCDELLNFMTENNLQLVFVCDEYGGVTGIVTIEDLLEEIVGSITDEYDDEEEEIIEVNDTTVNFDGTTLLCEVEETLSVHFPEDGDCDTLGGYIIDSIGKIPDEDERPEISYGGWRFKVNGVAERRITTVTAERETETEE